MARVLDNQIALDLFEKFTPGNCKNETKTVDIGGGKSFCELFGCWTNCREVNHCTYEKGAT